MQAEGITPGEIDTVILTHGHPDHIGGNTVSDGRPAFPNAWFVIWKDEWDFWTSDLEELKGEEHVKELLVSFTRRNLPPIQDQFYLIDHEMEIVPDIQALAAFGHTPGQIAVPISSGSEHLLYISYAALHPIHVE
jgi:glyoxylase-like metal-dependent hydrolase (beta-lactamase superfamily II)